MRLMEIIRLEEETLLALKFLQNISRCGGVGVLFIRIGSYFEFEMV